MGGAWGSWRGRKEMGGRGWGEGAGRGGMEKMRGKGRSHYFKAVVGRGASALEIEVQVNVEIVGGLVVGARGIDPPTRQVVLGRRNVVVGRVGWV